MNLRFAEMKITARLAILNFDQMAFFDRLDFTADNVMFLELLHQLADKY